MSTYFDDLPTQWRGSNPLVNKQDGINTTLAVALPASLADTDVVLTDASDFPEGGGDPVEAAIINPTNPYQVDEVVYDWSSIDGNTLKSPSRLYGTACALGSRVIIGWTANIYTLILECLETLLSGTREDEWKLNDIALQRLAADTLKILQGGGGDILMIVGKILYALGTDTALLKPDSDGLVVRNEADDDYKSLKAATPGASPDEHELVTVGYVQAYLESGLSWKKSVISQGDTSPPGAPNTGDRYLIGAGATGDWSGHDDDIAEYNGSGWDYTEPEDGFAVIAEDEDRAYVYDGAAWVTFGSIIDHTLLQNIGVYTHAQIDTHIDSTGHRTTVSTQSLSDDGTITVDNPKVELIPVQGDGAAVVLDTDPAIQDGTVDGQTAIIEGRNNTNTVTIADGANILLRTSSITLAAGDRLEIIWVSSANYWRETGRYPESAENVTEFDTEVTNHADVSANTSHRNTVSGNPHNVTLADIGSFISAKNFPTGEQSDEASPDKIVAIAPPSRPGSGGMPSGRAIPGVSYNTLREASPILFNVGTGQVNGVSNGSLPGDWQQPSDAWPLADGERGVGIFQFKRSTGEIRMKANKSSASTTTVYEGSAKEDLAYDGSADVWLFRPYTNNGAEVNLGEIEELWFYLNAAGNFYLVVYEFTAPSTFTEIWKSSVYKNVTTTGTPVDLASYFSVAERTINAAFPNGSNFCFGWECVSSNNSVLVGSDLTPPTTDWDAMGVPYHKCYKRVSGAWSQVTGGEDDLSGAFKVNTSYEISYPEVDSGFEVIGYIGSPNYNVMNNFDGDTTATLERVPMEDLLSETGDAVPADGTEAFFALYPDAPINYAIVTQEVSADEMVNVPYYCTDIHLTDDGGKVDLGTGQNVEDGWQYGQRLRIYNAGSNTITFRASAATKIVMANSDAIYAMEPGEFIELVWTEDALSGPADGWVEVFSNRADSRLTQPFANTEYEAQSSDPDDPAPGYAVFWLSDGTGAGDDGDFCYKITPISGSTKSGILIDYSAV